MYSAKDIARHLVRIGWSPESPGDSVLLCPLRLQKELYYCQGWHLALFGVPLFPEPIEAWVNGPVVVSVYEQFRGKRDGIRPDEAGEPTAPLEAVRSEFLQSVWQEYARFTPKMLIAMTHSEPAWKEARNGLPADTKSSNALSLETMKTYFEDLMRARTHSGSKFPDANPADVWQSEREAELHPEQLHPMGDVINRIKSRRMRA